MYHLTDGEDTWRAEPSPYSAGTLWLDPAGSPNTLWATNGTFTMRFDGTALYPAPYLIANYDYPTAFAADPKTGVTLMGLQDSGLSRVEPGSIFPKPAADGIDVPGLASSFIVDRSNRQHVLFARANRQMFESNDFGASMHPIGTRFPDYIINRMSYDPREHKLYASYSSTLYVLDVAAPGAWQVANFEAVPSPYNVAVAETDGTTCVTNLLDTACRGPAQTQFAVLPTGGRTSVNPSIFFVMGAGNDITVGVGNGSTLQRWHSGDSTWTTVPLPAGVSSITNVAVSRDGGTVAMGTNVGVYTGFGTWTSVAGSLGTPYIYSLAFLDGQTLLAASNSTALQRCTLGSSDWAPVYNASDYGLTYAVAAGDAGAFIIYSATGRNFRGSLGGQ